MARGLDITKTKKEKKKSSMDKAIERSKNLTEAGKLIGMGSGEIAKKRLNKQKKKTK